MKFNPHDTLTRVWALIGFIIMVTTASSKVYASEDEDDSEDSPEMALYTKKEILQMIAPSLTDVDKDKVNRKPAVLGPATDTPQIFKAVTDDPSDQSDDFN